MLNIQPLTPLELVPVPTVQLPDFPITPVLIESLTTLTTRVTSGGNSCVWLTPTRATQVFHSQSEFNQVNQFIQDVSKATDPVHVWLDSEYYTYNLQDFLAVPRTVTAYTQTIEWERVECLNEMDSTTRYRFVHRHTEQLTWNILKAIVGINLYGYVHNDVSLDNIGIHKGRFVLYDYNMSKRGNDLYRDLNSFKRSVTFHTSGTLYFDYLESIQPLDDFVYHTQQVHQMSSAREAIEYLDSLRV